MAIPVTSRPTPVFVLGLQRSGTTWLANVIAHHSRAVAVQSPDHFGIFESIFFSHFAPAYGDLNDASNFRRFAMDFSTSDYYLLTGLEPSWLWNIKSRSYPEIFRALMEEVARQHGGADFWVEKSPAHTALAEDLAAAFPDARFICIVRRQQTAIASQLWLHDRPRSQWARVKALLSSCLGRSQQRLLTAFCQHQDRCFLARYEDFVADAEGVSRRICEFLGITYEPAMLDLPWGRNTSFKSIDRRRALGVSDRIVIGAASAVLSIVPLRVLRFILSRRLSRQRERVDEIVFPHWTWGSRNAGLAGSSRDCGQSKPIDGQTSGGTDNRIPDN